jgi:site-specific DNA recombinase
LVAGEVQSISEIARREGITVRYVSRLIRLGFLAPEIVEAMVEGRQPAELSAESLSRHGDLPLDWQQQRAALGFV